MNLLERAELKFSKVKTLRLFSKAIRGRAPNDSAGPGIDGKTIFWFITTEGEVM